MLLTWSTVLATVGSCILAAAILIKAKKTAGNIFFALFSFSLAFLVAANYFSLNSKSSPEMTLFWIRLVMFSVPFVLLFIYGFGCSYLNPNYKINQNTLSLLAFVTFIIALMNLTPLSYKFVTISPTGKIIPTTGPGMFINGLYIIPLFAAAIGMMIKNIRRAEEAIDKKRIEVALFLFLISFGTQIVTSFILVALFNFTDLVFIGNFLSLLFIVTIGISILRLKLFGLNVISSSVFAVVITLLMFAEIFTATTPQYMAYKLIVFGAVSFTSYQLLRSIILELQQKKEIEELARDFKKANEKLKEIDNMKNEFVAMASHELLTPISAIEGYLSMMLDEKLVEIDDPKAIRYMRRVYDSSKRLAELVSGLLNVSRIEQGRLLVQPDIINLPDLVENVLDELKFTIKEADVRVKSDLSKSLSPVYADSDKVREVLINLCSNALKYTPAQGNITISAELRPTRKVLEQYLEVGRAMLKKNNPIIEETLQCTINEKTKCMAGENQLVIAVKDTGVGIIKEDLHRLFQKFSQLGSWSHHSIPGTGLGLYISQSLIELQHGRMWAESEGKNKGSTFYFSLPLATEKESITKINKLIPVAKDAKSLAKVAKP